MNAYTVTSEPVTRVKGRITKNFSVAEIASRGDLPLNDDITRFVQMAQELRDWAAEAYPYHKKNGLIISNCYRSEKHNEEIKGSINSAHLDGRAMDITNVRQPLYESFTQVWRSICQRHNKIGGINYYSWGIHITDYEDKFGHTEFVIRDKR